MVSCVPLMFFLGLSVLNVVLQTYPQQELQSIGNLKELVDGLVAYTGEQTKILFTC